MIDLFPVESENDIEGSGGRTSNSGGMGGGQMNDSGGTNSGGVGGAFPVPPGEPTLLKLNTDAPCPDDISFTDDLLEMVFDSEESILLTSRRDSRLSPWSEAVPLIGIGAPGFDSGAEISHDGLSLWWMSSRPDGSELGTLWTSTRPTRSSPWEAPTRLAELDGPSNEAFPTVTNDGLLLVYVSDQDLYSATRDSVDSPWSTPVELTDVNTARADTGPQLSADGLTLYFTSTRLGGQGGTDIYASHRASREENFGSPEPMVDLNTPMNEHDPWVSSDGTLLVFQRKDSGGDCSFFSVEL